MKTPSAPTHPGASILLVDDNPHGMVARKTVLEQLGYVIYIGRAGEEALEIIANQKIDLVVTDYRMPNMHGGELIARIRQLQQDIPIILLSGFVEPLGLTEESTGADLVLAKSASEVSLLIRAVQRLLNRQPPSKPADSERTRQRARIRNAG